ncbi:hypothetical protein [Aquibacillus saliphilus]|uniref:hypothetical protein n=1 Tax=Aquibacillus saliphilus TaxID=1909422 RepID=UPI001CEFE4FC|nr:hypothetical protein [Aquibacillus saliphilus]
MSDMKILLIVKEMKKNLHERDEGHFECISGTGIMHASFKLRRSFYQLRRFENSDTNERAYS